MSPVVNETDFILIIKIIEFNKANHDFQRWLRIEVEIRSSDLVLVALEKSWNICTRSEKRVDKIHENSEGIWKHKMEKELNHTLLVKIIMVVPPYSGKLINHLKSNILKVFKSMLDKIRIEFYLQKSLHSFSRAFSKNMHRLPLSSILKAFTVLYSSLILMSWWATLKALKSGKQSVFMF